MVCSSVANSIQCWQPKCKQTMATILIEFYLCVQYVNTNSLSKPTYKLNTKKKKKIALISFKNHFSMSLTLVNAMHICIAHIKRTVATKTRNEIIRHWCGHTRKCKGNLSTFNNIWGGKKGIKLKFPFTIAPSCDRCRLNPSIQMRITLIRF